MPDEKTGITLAADPSITERLNAIQRKAHIPVSIPTLRTLDVVVWMATHGTERSQPDACGRAGANVSVGALEIAHAEPTVRWGRLKGPFRGSRKPPTALRVALSDRDPHEGTLWRGGPSALSM